MSLHLSAPVHVFAPQLVNVSPPQLLLLLPELLCLLSLGGKKTSQLENILVLTLHLISRESNTHMRRKKKHLHAA